MKAYGIVRSRLEPFRAISKCCFEIALNRLEPFLTCPCKNDIASIVNTYLSLILLILYMIYIET